MRFEARPSAAAASRSARATARCARSTLNALSRYGRAPARCGAPRAASVASSSALADQRLLGGRARATGLCATPPSAMRAPRTRSPSHVERRRHRYQRERVAGAIAHLQIMRMRRRTATAAGRTAVISSPWRKLGVALRRVARQPVEFADRYVAARRAAPRTSTTRVQRGQRHAHVGRMRRDALLACAEDRVDAVVAVERRAAASRACACCTRRSRRRRSNGSACAAADCRRRWPCCAAAARRPASERLRQQRIALADQRMRSRGRCSVPARRCACRHRATLRCRAAAAA